MFLDERGYYISEMELMASYAVLKANKETDCETYEQYVVECCGKNGTLTKVPKRKDKIGSTTHGLKTDGLV